ncbi:MAG: hypothetical protein COA78_13565 [Blastopirellula sp.]|nr:MAG: hypothetical protein COA78_13565 [Blastopirellula sp.]
MSQKLINHSPDLLRLKEDGYEISIKHGHLVVRGIPYVNENREVKTGILVSTLALSGDKTRPPDTHIMMFSGEYPCDNHGQKLTAIAHTSQRKLIGGELTIDHSFSSKPKSGGYVDYFEKISTYAAIIANQAAALRVGITPRTYRVIESPDDSPFVYFDNASGRAGITAVTEKLKLGSIGLVGLGGTGGYILDLVAKTPAQKIHLYDDDHLEQHNAFRAPGAATLQQLRERPYKVDYFARIYSEMHTGIVPHAHNITEENVDQLLEHDFVFLCMDANDEKAAIVAALLAKGIPFIDVGMGLELIDNGLTGIVRTTIGTPEKSDHIYARGRIPMIPRADDNLYASNIQVADLNALNAALAVIRWKKYFGVYKDTEHEHFSAFTLDGNYLLNEDAA